MKEDGSSAVGTALSPGPALDNLLQGLPYQGLSTLPDGNLYYTKYLPALDEKKKPIGAIFTGFYIKSQIEQMKHDIRANVFMNSGHSMVIDIRKGVTQGQALVYPTDVGKKNLLETSTDANGEKYLAKMAEEAEKNKYQWSWDEKEKKSVHHMGIMEYTLLDESGGKHEKVACFEIYPAWGVLVITEVDKSDLYAAKIAMIQFLAEIGVAASALLSLVLIIWLRRNITKPVAEVNQFIEYLGNKDLTKEIAPKLRKRNDEIGLIARGVESARCSLREVVSMVSDAASAMNKESAGLLESSGTLQQQSSEETARLEELSAVSTNGLDRAKEAGDLAKGVQEASKCVSLSVLDSDSSLQDSSESLKRVQEYAGMGTEQIKKSAATTRRVSTIANVINDIADKTNLLALNAAIEAARAGESGRGFAVVADEVRKLAEMTRNSTKEIENLIAQMSLESEEAVQASGMVVQEVATACDKQLSMESDIKKINVSQSEVLRQVEQILRTVSDQLESFNQIHEHVNESGRSAIATGQVAVSVRNKAEAISSIASQLDAGIHQFTI